MIRVRIPVEGCTISSVVEHGAYDAAVTGSNPVWYTNLFNSVVECQVKNLEDMGSNPITDIIFIIRFFYLHYVVYK